MDEFELHWHMSYIAKLGHCPLNTMIDVKWRSMTGQEGLSPEMIGCANDLEHILYQCCKRDMKNFDSVLKCVTMAHKQIIKTTVGIVTTDDGNSTGEARLMVLGSDNASSADTMETDDDMDIS